MGGSWWAAQALRASRRGWQVVGGPSAACRQAGAAVRMDNRGPHVPPARPPAHQHRCQQEVRAAGADVTLNRGERESVYQVGQLCPHHGEQLLGHAAEDLRPTAGAG